MRKLANAELNRISKEAFAEAKKTPLIIVLDDIRSLHNIGSVFRTADAFLIEKIYFAKNAIAKMKSFIILFILKVTRKLRLQ